MLHIISSLETTSRRVFDRRAGDWGTPNIILQGAPKTFTSVAFKSAFSDAGFWSCSPGKIRVRKSGVAELMLVLGGEAEFEDGKGEFRRVSAGSVVLVEDGYDGVWLIHDEVKKFYVNYNVSRG